MFYFIGFSHSNIHSISKDSRTLKSDITEWPYSHLKVCSAVYVELMFSNNESKK